MSRKIPGYTEPPTNALNGRIAVRDDGKLIEFSFNDTERKNLLAILNNSPWSEVIIEALEVAVCHSARKQWYIENRRDRVLPLGNLVKLCKGTSPRNTPWLRMLPAARLRSIG